jgi:hypothetical protein
VAAAALGAGCGQEAESSPTGQDAQDPTLRALPEGGAEVAQSRIDPLFGEAADEITNGRFSFEVRCWNEIDWDEVMAYWEPETAEPGGSQVAAFIAGLSDVQLSPEVCRTLTRFAYGPPRLRRSRPSLQTAFAIVVFAHEIGHSVVGDSESATECWAMQQARTVASVLGATPSSAALVGRLYFRQIYSQDLPEYQSPECRDGGSLDLRPGRDGFP